MGELDRRVESLAHLLAGGGDDRRCSECGAFLDWRERVRARQRAGLPWADVMADRGDKSSIVWELREGETRRLCEECGMILVCTLNLGAANVRTDDLDQEGG